MSAASGGVKPQAASPCPCRSSCRRYEAEAVPPSGAPSWAAPVRSRVAGVMDAPVRRRARRYSTASVLLGLSSRAASASPSRAAAARWRRTAKVAPLSAAVRRSAKAGLSRQSASRRKADSSPHSLPNSSVSTPVSASSCTPPRANVSAGDMAQTVGSSTTRSAPQRTAISARARLSSAAKLPRWVKLPLMAQITASAPMARAWDSSRAWPLWRGSNSQIIPMYMGGSFPFSLFYRGTGQNAT